MKIREIMKRTMAIGLATAMLLQSQSVVTLAETVQADAAETVVVDVGEETSVSGNGEEKKEEAEAEAEDINSDDPTIETETDEEEEASEESLIDENELEANMQFCESVESEIAADQAIDTTGFKDTYGLSYEELFTACPSYLDNMTAETIFNMMSDNAGEAWTEGLAQKDMAKAVYMMTQGSSYAIKNFWQRLGSHSLIIVSFRKKWQSVSSKITCKQNRKKQHITMRCLQHYLKFQEPIVTLRITQH